MFVIKFPSVALVKYRAVRLGESKQPETETDSLSPGFFWPRLTVHFNWRKRVLYVSASVRRANVSTVNIIDKIGF